MELYTFLRELADSWALLAMTVFFLGVVVWVFRPGVRAVHDDISQIPFRNETLPTCENACPDCKNGGACKTIKFEVQ
ncbi:MAG: cbb3-type cytochrome c oxidase subunit 3 [Pseudomonadota bacterium]